MSGSAPAGRSGQPEPERDRSGEILAARWSIERLRRPAGPDLVWLPYAKPEVVRFACLACGDAGFKQGVLRAEGRTLYLCGGCASHQMYPVLRERPATGGFALRLRREYLSELAATAALAAWAVAGRSTGRLLELADGDGLLADMAAGRPGWSAVAIDPDRLDAGAAALGAFSVVLGDGAMQRSADPLTMLTAARAAAAPDARWLLTSADAATLYAATDASGIRRLVTADTLLLPSRVGLRRLLARAGLEALQMRADGETLHAEHDPPVEPVLAGDVLDAFLTRRAADPPADASLRTGLLVRALARAVERRDWAAGRALAAVLAPALAAAGEAARVAGDQHSLEELFRNAPLCAPALLYAVGMLQLHGDGPSTQALLCFELCAVLARRAHALAPALPQPEAERQFAARFQAGLVRRRLGETEAARTALATLAAAGEAAAAAWALRAREELAGMAPAAEPAAAVAARKQRRTARAAG